MQNAKPDFVRRHFGVATLLNICSRKSVGPDRRRNGGAVTLCSAQLHYILSSFGSQSSFRDSTPRKEWHVIDVQRRRHRDSDERLRQKHRRRRATFGKERR